MSRGLELIVSRALGLVCLCILAGALIVSFWTYFPSAFIPRWLSWLLHIATMFAVLLMIGGCTVLTMSLPHMREPNKPARAEWNAAMWRFVPHHTRVLGVVLFFYAIGTGYSSYHPIRSSFEKDALVGLADEKEGEFVLVSHGKVLRSLSEDEYRLCRAREVRTASACWIMFSAIPTLFFLQVVPRIMTNVPVNGSNADGESGLEDVRGTGVDRGEKMA